MKNKLFILFLYLFSFTLQSCSQPDVHGEPTEVQQERYVVKYRPSGSSQAWQALDVNTAQVDLHNVRTTRFTQLDMSSPIDVMVRFKETIRKVNIRPTQKNINYIQEGDSIYFTLNQPAYLSVEFNDDRFGNLQFFADQTAEAIPDGAGVIRFAPGYYETYNGQPVMNVPGNTTVVIEQGAVLGFQVQAMHVQNVRILGRGQIRAKTGDAMRIKFSHNVTVDGITLVNPTNYSIFGGQSTDVTIRNLKSFSSVIWSDGIDMMSCSDVLIDNVFLRNSDDCLAFYTHRWDFWGDSRNITVQNSILWADKAHPINIASHGEYETDNSEFIEDYIFRNLDILEHHEKDPIYQGCLAVTCGDNNTVRRLLFEDIRIENVEEGKLFYFAVQANPDFNTVPGKAIENITIRNVTYTPEYPSRNYLGKSVFKGFDDSRMVKNITIENVTVNGARMTHDYLETNGFVEGLTIQ